MGPAEMSLHPMPYAHLLLLSASMGVSVFGTAVIRIFFSWIGPDAENGLPHRYLGAERRQSAEHGSTQKSCNLLQIPAAKPCIHAQKKLSRTAQLFRLTTRRVTSDGVSASSNKKLLRSYFDAALLQLLMLLIRLTHRSASIHLDIYRRTEMKIVP